MNETEPGMSEWFSWAKRRESYINELVGKIEELKTDYSALAHFGIDPYQYLDTLFLLQHNSTITLKVINDLFPGAHPSYIREWLARFDRGFESVWTKLDDEKKAEFIAILVDIIRKGKEPRAKNMSTLFLIQDWKQLKNKISQLTQENYHLRRRLEEKNV